MNEFTSKHADRSESMNKIDWVKQDKISLRASHKTFQEWPCCNWYIQG